MRAFPLPVRSTLLCIVACSAVIFSALACAATEENISETFEVYPGVKLIVEVDFGNIEVTRGEENKVTVNAFRKLTADNEAREKEYTDAVPIQIGKEGNTVVVRARRSERQTHWHWRGSNNMQAQYTVRVPGNLESLLSTGGGSISASDTAGRLKANTGGGDLKFQHLRGPLNAESGGGRIDLTACDGALQMETGGGKISAEGGSGGLTARTGGGAIGVRNFDGDARVETGGGQLTLVNIRGRLNAETGGGAIRAEFAAPVAAETRLETSAGRIEVVLPADAALNLEAESSEGSVTSELPVVAARAGRDGLKGTINGGGKPLILRTGAGGIAIKSTGSSSPTR